MVKVISVTTPPTQGAWRMGKSLKWSKLLASVPADSICVVHQSMNPPPPTVRMDEYGVNWPAGLPPAFMSLHMAIRLKCKYTNQHDTTSASDVLLSP